jgi:hypothetical protein
MLSTILALHSLRLNQFTSSIVCDRLLLPFNNAATFPGAQIHTVGMRSLLGALLLALCLVSQFNVTNHSSALQVSTASSSGRQDGLRPLSGTVLVQYSSNEFNMAS